MHVQNCPILFRCFIYSLTFLSNSAQFVSHDDNQVEDFTIACCITIIHSLPWRIYPLIQRAALSHPATHHKIECIHYCCADRKTEGNQSVYPTP